MRQRVTFPQHPLASPLPSPLLWPPPYTPDCSIPTSFPSLSLSLPRDLRSSFSYSPSLSRVTTHHPSWSLQFTPFSYSDTVRRKRRDRDDRTGRQRRRDHYHSSIHSAFHPVSVVTHSSPSTPRVALPLLFRGSTIPACPSTPPGLLFEPDSPAAFSRSPPSPSVPLSSSVSLSHTCARVHASPAPTSVFAVVPLHPPPPNETQTIGHHHHHRSHPHAACRQAYRQSYLLLSPVICIPS